MITKMYFITGILYYLVSTIDAASYQRYGESTGGQYSTIANLNPQIPYRNTYANQDVSRFPEVTRYPNYSPGGYSSTSGYNNNYNSYSTPYNSYSVPNNGYLGGSSGGYTTPRYGEVYGRGNSGYSSYEVPYMRDARDYCVNRGPQTEILMSDVMGMWYGVEIVQHLVGDTRDDYYTRTCIVIHIAEPIERPSTEHQLHHVQAINAKFRQEYRHLRLLWDEAGSTVEYSLYFRNDSSGYWMVADGQNGSLVNKNYQQFTGSIQVLKAVSDHLVLTFCQEPVAGRPAQLYTVLFSRDPGVMARWERDAVHNMLQTKQLSVASIRMVCGNSGANDIFSYISGILSILMALAIMSSY